VIFLYPLLTDTRKLQKLGQLACSAPDPAEAAYVDASRLPSRMGHSSHAQTLL